jgi:hypothetical protein
MNKPQSGCEAYIRKIKRIEKELDYAIKNNEDFNKDKRMYIELHINTLKYLYEQEKLTDSSKDIFKIEVSYSE